MPTRPTVALIPEYTYVDGHRNYALIVAKFLSRPLPELFPRLLIACSISAVLDLPTE